MRSYNQRLDAASIKETIDPYDFYLCEQDLPNYGHRFSSWAIAGLCPFHDDHNPGSFKVDLKTGAFKCWSCGASGGDIIAFLQKRDSLSFLETLEKLVEEWEVGVC